MSVSRSALVTQLLLDGVAHMRRLVEVIPPNPTPADLVRMRGESIEEVRARIGSLKSLENDLFSGVTAGAICMRVFCDWLDVTFAPSDCPYPELNRLLLDAGYAVLFSDGSAFGYAPPEPAHGSLQVKHCSRWARVSVSGGACSHLQQAGLWMEFLSVLSSSPHKVTRLDAALDLAMDGADLVAAMRERYASGACSLGRKSIPTSVMLNVRPDGRETGTWYAGHRTRARTTARVYDKAWEMLQKCGAELPPTARVEVTGREGTGVTLRDAAEPAGFFLVGRLTGDSERS